MHAETNHPQKLAAFEKDFGYDASYMHDLLDTDFGAFRTWSRAVTLGGYRKDVPLDVYTAVGLVGVVAADCGPCAQLGITMALREGVPVPRSRRSCEATSTR